MPRKEINGRGNIGGLVAMLRSLRRGSVHFTSTRVNTNTRNKPTIFQNTYKLHLKIKI